MWRSACRDAQRLALIASARGFILSPPKNCIGVGSAAATHTTRWPLAATAAVSAAALAAHLSSPRLEGAEAAPEKDAPVSPTTAVTPPAKLDDPEENAKILARWRERIQTARECFRTLDIQGAERELQLAIDDAAHFGGGSGPMATSLLNLAQLYRRAGRMEDALPLLERAADTLDQTAGPHNKVTLLALVDLASTHFECGNLVDAAEGFEDVLRRLDTAETTQAHGRNELRAVRASVLLQAAKVDCKVGQLQAAESKLQESLLLAQERWGKDSPRLVAPLTELAELLLAEGRIDEARAYCAEGERLALKSVQKEKLAELNRSITASAAPASS